MTLPRDLLPPSILADAQTDRVHVDIGHGRAVDVVRVPLPREPEPRLPTREDIDAAVRRLDEALVDRTRERRERPEPPPAESYRDLREV